MQWRIVEGDDFSLLPPFVVRCMRRLRRMLGVQDDPKMGERARRSGKRRLTPFANGLYDGTSVVLVAVQGHHSDFAHNIAADPRVRLKRRGRWRSGTAELIDPEAATLARFSFYARSGLRALAEDPKLLRIDFDPADRLHP